MHYFPVYAVFLACAVTVGTVEAQPAANKTLVSWVCLDQLQQGGGSVITLQDRDRFDAIVFGEIEEGKWMAGSNGFSRTQKEQQAYPAETAGPDTLIQMAIVYDNNTISIYRNGEKYASYETENIDLLTSENNMAVFGLRHVGAASGDRISGKIEDARIYDRALTADELKSLKPNETTEPGLYAWWDFEAHGKEKTGRFPHFILEGGGKLVDGKLVLNNKSVFVAVRRENAVMRSEIAEVPFEIETPRMPEDPPDTWLTYHLAHPGPGGAIPADPNCAIYYNGKYHLHYIYQSHGHSFAHLTSDDMVHWEWQPTVLTPPITGHGMFSGTAFLTKGGKPAIIYHGEGSGRNQIALALDEELNQWSKTIAVEPRDAAGKPAEMRHWDPDCWLIGDTYYALAGGQNPTFSTSTNLKDWNFEGCLFHDDFPEDIGVSKDEDVSCANMFRIGDKWMLLCISHYLGARYYLGDFRDGKYLPEQHALLNWAGWDFFAPESLLTPDGRRVMWAWCTPWVNDMQERVKRKKDFDRLLNEKLQPGIQSLPRELSIGDDGSLCIKPLRELESLRRDEKQLENVTIASGETCLLPGISGDTIELEMVFNAPTADAFGVRLFATTSGEGGFPILAGNGRDTLTIDYIDPPFTLRDGEDLTLRIFIDKGMVEVFANDRQAAVAWHDYEPENQHVAVFSDEGEVSIKKIRAWAMNSIY